MVNLLTGLEDSNNWLEAGFVSLRAGETVAVSSAGTFIKPVALLRYHTGTGTGTSYHTIPYHITSHCDSDSYSDTIPHHITQ